MRRIGLILLAALGCASGMPRFAQMDSDTLLQYGLDRAEERKWNEAARALEQFIFQHPTHPRYQEARFRLGEVYAGKKEHLSAASEFSRLADDFPAGPWADDARFQVCQSYNRLSPRPELDQEYTRSAIDHCRSLIAFYPESDFVPEARAVIIGLENKLADKVYRNGDYYYKRNAFDSAIIYFEDVLEAYPTSASAPKALLRLFEAYVRIGFTEEAGQMRERLLREFPDSEEAEQIRNRSALSTA